MAAHHNFEAMASKLDDTNLGKAPLSTKYLEIMLERTSIQSLGS